MGCQGKNTKKGRRKTEYEIVNKLLFWIPVNKEMRKRLIIPEKIQEKILALCHN